mgnify:CR=1 FL=1
MVKHKLITKISEGITKVLAVYFPNFFRYRRDSLQKLIVLIGITYRDIKKQDYLEMVDTFVKNIKQNIKEKRPIQWRKKNLKKW